MDCATQPGVSWCMPEVQRTSLRKYTSRACASAELAARRSGSQHATERTRNFGTQLRRQPSRVNLAGGGWCVSHLASRFAPPFAHASWASKAPDNGQGRFAGRCWRVLLRAVLQELSWRYTLWHLLLGLHAVWLPLRPHIPSRRARLLLHPGLRRVRLPVQQDGQAGRPANSSSFVHVRFHSDGTPEGACHGSEALVQKDVLGRRDS